MMLYKLLNYSFTTLLYCLTIIPLSLRMKMIKTFLTQRSRRLHKVHKGFCAVLATSYPLWAIIAFFVSFVTSSYSLWFILLKFFDFAQNDENENIFHTKLSKFTRRSQRGCAVLATSCHLGVINFPLCMLYDLFF